MAETTARTVGDAELGALKVVALEGGLDGEVKVSCRGLGERLDASTQTASRRLQALDGADLVARETVGDGQWIRVTDAGERVLRGEYESYRRIFERASSVTLSGAVTSGMGEGRHYITLPGYMEQFEERLGYAPFPGTLNVALDETSERSRARMEHVEPVRIDGWEDEERTYGPAFCYPATVEAEGETYDRAHVIAPERTHHDDDQAEVIAPEKLRDVLDLADDQVITITVEGAT